MKSSWALVLIIFILFITYSCKDANNKNIKVSKVTAKEILGNKAYTAISYGGFRQKSREIEPTLEEIKEDVKIMHAMGIRILRTYNVQFDEVKNLLFVIDQLMKEDPTFEMYLMMGIWIDCKNAWTSLPPDHEHESEKNEAEVGRAVSLANQYPHIVKIMAVGNEAMVKWATSYYVQPGIILKWVNHLQNLKKKGELPADMWITSSDNFASWGGGDSTYHVKDLTELIKAVDYISMHTYPMHDTHYNPDFWGVPEEEEELDDMQKIAKAMNRSLNYAKSQYKNVKKYVESLGINKPIHIGETGWSSYDNHFYGDEGSRANDEYKSGLYYKMIREWTDHEGITCFYFEAFDEQWKDANNPKGSENHFGLINLQSEAKFAIWDLVDKGVFNGLTRDGKPITKTFKGDTAYLMKYVKIPPLDTIMKAN